MNNRNPLRRFLCYAILAGILGLPGAYEIALAQTVKPRRERAPTFRPGEFDGIFFADPVAQLQGEMPTSGASQPSPGSPNSAPQSPSKPASNSSTDDPQGWKQLIDPTSLEDLVKGSKLRLDAMVTTPTAFKGGGFSQARTEFSLQALLFAIIESYPGEVRWKNSASLARLRFTRVAANTKVGSDQVFAEAKTRLLDLEDLIGGTPLTAQNEAAGGEIDWSNLIDRVPLMQLLEWAHEENLTKLVVSEADFKDNNDAVQRFAELIAVLGQVALAEEMPDAQDEDYQTLAKAMIEQAGQVGLAVKTGNAELARQAAAQIGQSCTNCHDSFR